MNSPGDSSKGELELIRRLSRELAATAAEGRSPPGGEPAAVPFGDDMAALQPGDPNLLWTTDMLMDGVDFDSARQRWYDIGRKAMAANLSDCAAMAAVPVAALCAVALSNGLSMDDALDLLRGARDCGMRFGCPLVGGDTNSWDQPTVISIAIAARTEAGRRPVQRCGARPDDRIFVSGPVGGSILGRHLSFEPRIETALAINRQLDPHAMIDISDGLAIDLWRVLEASGCGAVLDASSLKAAIHPDAVRLAAQDGVTPREHALYDGEDFELIVFLPPEVPTDACRRLGLLPLGHATRDRRFLLRERDGRRVEIERRGWEHFR